VEDINTFDGEPTETAEQQAELIRVAEGGTPAPASAGSDRPEWLPEKFKSAEDLAQAYSELERRLGSDDNDDEETDETDEDFDPNEFSPPEVSEYLAEQNL